MIFVYGVTDGKVTGQSQTTLKVIEILKNKHKDSVLHIEQPSKLSISAFFLYYLKIFYFCLIYKDTKIYISISRTMKSFYARDLIVLLISLLKNDPCIIHLVGNDLHQLLKKSYIAKIIYRAILKRKKNYFIVLSERMKSDLSDLLRLEGEFAQFVILPGFVDFEVDHHKLPFKKRLSDKQPLTIGFMSNLIPEKGIFDFLDAIELLFSKSDTNKYFVWVAGVKQAHVDYSQLDRLTKYGWIKYYNFIEGQKKAALLDKTDIFVLPSYYPTEVLPLSLIQAAAHGAFIVSCSTGDIEMVVKLARGKIVPTKDPKAICDSIENFANISDFDPSETSKAICTYFSADSYVDKLQEIFEQKPIIPV